MIYTIILISFFIGVLVATIIYGISSYIKNIKKIIKYDSKIINKAYCNGILEDQEFRVILSDFLISEGGYVLDTGSNKQANAEIVLRLAHKIDKHPIIWNLFFMIA